MPSSQASGHGGWFVNSLAQRWKYFTTQLDGVYCWNCKVSVSTSSNTMGKYALGKLELLKSSTTNIWNTCTIQMSQKIVLSVQNGKKGTVHSVRVFVHSTGTWALQWHVVSWWWCTVVPVHHLTRFSKDKNPERWRKAPSSNTLFN